MEFISSYRKFPKEYLYLISPEKKELMNKTKIKNNLINYNYNFIYSNKQKTKLIAIDFLYILKINNLRVGDRINLYNL